MYDLHVAHPAKLVASTELHVVRCTFQGPEDSAKRGIAENNVLKNEYAEEATVKKLYLCENKGRIILSEE